MTIHAARVKRPRSGPFPGVLTYLKRLVKHSLILDFRGRRLAFDTLEDFAEWLNPRTNVPFGKIHELENLSNAELRSQAAEIRALERKLANVLVHAIENPQSIGTQIRSLGLNRFSLDNDWRHIMESLLVTDPIFPEHGKLAVAKYLQYLNDREDTLKAICQSREMDWYELHQDDVNRHMEPSLRATGVFDFGLLQQAREEPNPHYERVPIGETVRLSPPPGGQILMRLSQHRFTLITGSRCELVDARGRRWEIRPGRNVVGRNLDNEVVVDSGLKDISRVHVMLELGASGTLELTDYSSQGTFLACGFAPVTSRRHHLS